MCRPSDAREAGNEAVAEDSLDFLLGEYFSNASVLTVLGTNTAADGNLPAVQYKAAHANADVFVRDAPGGFGIAVDAPGETATVGDVNVSAADTQTRVQIGGGVT